MKQHDDLRWFKGKRIVSLLRGGDYAHAGEEEAIKSALKNIPKNPNQLILDVGCGQGGTANYLQQQGWGKIVGIDIEKESIEYATKTYPCCEFHASDAAAVYKIFPNREFDIITIFNAFLVFPKQFDVLKSLRQVAKDDSTLVIFEYTDLTLDDNNPLEVKDDPHNAFIFIKPKTIAKMLQQTGWKLISFIDQSADFKRWYNELLHRLDKKQHEVINLFGQEWYERTLKRYTSIYEAMVNGTTGGCTLLAKASPHH